MDNQINLQNAYGNYSIFPQAQLPVISPSMNQNNAVNQPYDWMEMFNAYMKKMQDMSVGDAMSLQFKQNPFGTITSLGNAGLNTIGSIWNMFQGYKSAKDQLALARDDYNLRKQAYEANEARNQERFGWLKQARATSQL